MVASGELTCDRQRSAAHSVEDDGHRGDGVAIGNDPVDEESVAARRLEVENEDSHLDINSQRHRQCVGTLAAVGGGQFVADHADRLASLDRVPSAAPEHVTLDASDLRVSALTWLRHARQPSVKVLVRLSRPLVFPPTSVSVTRD